MGAPWKLTVRAGSVVARERFASLDQALAAMDARLDDLAPNARRAPASVFGREYSAQRQVAARAEVAGPGRFLPDIRAGVDLRGDGTTQAWTGWSRRSLVEPAPGETAVEALARDLGRGGVVQDDSANGARGNGAP